jgi:hypothetical protein
MMIQRKIAWFAVGLALSPAHAADLTCRQWFDDLRKGHLSHGPSEAVASVNASISATFDTLEALRVDLAKSEHADPQPRDRDWMIRSVVEACAQEEATPVLEVLAKMRKVLIALELATWAKP